MKAKFLLALLPVVCLSWAAMSIHAQSNSSAGRAPAQGPRQTVDDQQSTGRIAGVLKDPSGAVVEGATVEIESLESHLRRSIVTDAEGRFDFNGLPAGAYQLYAIARGFATVVLHHVAVTPNAETPLAVALMIATAKTSVEVSDSGVEIAEGARNKVSNRDQERSRNAAELVGTTPGVSLRENGQLASVPLLHGLGDERTKLVVDGMTVSSACANHMNPPLSYIAPSQAAEVTVMAGITPVSQGGDSIGGTISIESPQPVFASPNERLHAEGLSTGFYRSNGQNYGGSLTEWVAGHNFGMGYTGSWATNDDYTDGGGHKVTSTYSQTTDHIVTVAARGAGNLVVLSGGIHHTPYEGFANAQMDLVRNYAESLNLHYRRSLQHGVLDTRAYWQNTWHSMNVGKDKSTFPMPMWMPMNTHGRDFGYSVKYEVPLADQHTLRVGNELHHFILNDKWPAVTGTAPMMGPNTFFSINDGRRVRLGTFAELASKWNPQWTTLFGLRNDTVWMNAGPVQGYSMMMYGADANAFNALNHAKTDVDFDLTGAARYEPNPHSSYEFGYARKNRSPNPYERYAWSTNVMASGMIGWFGDGNYYVGSLDLKPEIANHVSGTASWHSGDRNSFELEVTPYVNYIQDFVDVDTLMTTMYGMSTFAQLRFANHNARIDGVDVSGNGTIWNNSGFGQGKISGVAGWLHGERLDTSTGLYQIMPFNIRVAFDEDLKGFTAGMGLQAVDRKSNVDPHRFEQVTPGYALLNLQTGYTHGYFRMSIAAENLTNKLYELPLGGVNFDDYMASMWMGQIKPLTGRGRSVYGSLTARF